MNLSQVEREKYERVWDIPSYGDFSPGERLVEHFERICHHPLDEADVTIIDFGCGGGKASRLFQEHGFQHVIPVDHTRKGITDDRWEYLRDRFVEANLWHLDDVGELLAPAPNGLRIGYCTDVMEHIPIEATMLTIQQIMSHCDQCWFQICTLPDEFGKAIGEPLHVTVMPFTWWRDRLSEFGEIVDARDLMHAGVFYVLGR